MACYSISNHALSLNEATKHLQVTNLSTNIIVASYDIDGNGHKIYLNNGEFCLEECSVPGTYDTWPLDDHDFISGVNGGILTVDIRNFKQQDPRVAEFNLSVEDSYLIVAVEDDDDLLTHYHGS